MLTLNVSILLATTLTAFICHVGSHPALPQKIPSCPPGSRIMYRPDGEPRKCLPHQSNLCLNAIDDKTDASSVCCWHNQVDYFCCMDVEAEQCPQYSNVTVVIHNNFVHSAFPLKTFHFRRNIEDEFVQRN